MSVKEKIRIVVEVVGVLGLVFMISNTVEGRLVIDDLCINGINPREGCVDWISEENRNETANLTIRIDNNVTLQKPITSNIHHFAGRQINLKLWQHFAPNETSGLHVITVTITSSTGNSSETLSYEGWDITITEEE